MDAVKTGNLIREIRTEKGLTQQSLAEKLHVSATAVSKWENGHSLPDISLLEPLSSVLGISITDLVIGERSGLIMEQSCAVKPILEEKDLLMKSLLDESVKQRRNSMIRWAMLAVISAAAAAGCFFLFWIVGFRAKQEEIRVVTEIQEGWNGNPEWVIHFKTADGKPLYPYTTSASIPSEDGTYAIPSRVIHLRVAPLGHLEPDSYTWGYSIERGLRPVGNYDFYVIVDYADGQVTYSMREEGLFD